MFGRRRRLGTPANNGSSGATRGGPTRGVVRSRSHRMPNADSGRVALTVGCSWGQPGRSFVGERAHAFGPRARGWIAGTICRRDGGAARPVLVRAGHAVGDVDPVRRVAERGEGVTLWVRFLFIGGTAGVSEFEHRHRRGCRWASRHRNRSPKQSYGTRIPARHATGAGQARCLSGFPLQHAVGLFAGRATMSIAPAGSSPPSGGPARHPNSMAQAFNDRSGPPQLDSDET